MKEARREGVREKERKKELEKERVGERTSKKKKYERNKADKLIFIQRKGLIDRQIDWQIWQQWKNSVSTVMIGVLVLEVWWVQSSVRRTTLWSFTSLFKILNKPFNLRSAAKKLTPETITRVGERFWLNVLLEWNWVKLKENLLRHNGDQSVNNEGGPKSSLAEKFLRWRHISCWLYFFQAL